MAEGAGGEVPIDEDELAELEREFADFDENAVEMQIKKIEEKEKEAKVEKRGEPKDDEEKKRKKAVTKERKEIVAKQKEAERSKKKREREEKKNAKQKADAYRAVNASLKSTSLTLCDVFNGGMRKTAHQNISTTQETQIPSTPIDVIASQNSFSGLPTFETVASFGDSNSPLASTQGGSDFTKIRRHHTQVKEEDTDSDSCELELVDCGEEVLHNEDSMKEPIHNEESNHSLNSAADIDEDRLRERQELLMFRQAASSSLKFDLDSSTTSIADLLDRSGSTSLPTTTTKRRSLIRTSSTTSTSDIALLRKQSTVDTSSGQAMYTKAAPTVESSPSSAIPGMRKADSASQLHSLLAGAEAKAKRRKLK